MVKSNQNGAFKRSLTWNIWTETISFLSANKDFGKMLRESNNSVMLGVSIILISPFKLLLLDHIYDLKRYVWFLSITVKVIISVENKTRVL